MNKDAIKQQVIAASRTVFDPEIPINIYELGLIYDVDVNEEGTVSVRMTLTSPNCPVAESLPNALAQKIRTIPDVKDARVQIVFDPPWSREMMSEAAQLELEMMGIAGPEHLHKPKFTDVSIGRTTQRKE